MDNEPEFHNRLTRALEGTSGEVDPKDVPLIDYRSVSPEHEFPAKKSPKEQPSLDGVLRANWLSKHHDQLPSLTLLVSTFCVDWATSEWFRREALVFERFTKLKASLSSRDSKIVIITVKVGKVASADKDVMEERINSMRRHLALDTRTFLVVTIPETTALSPTMRRLVKTVRDFSNAYYTAQNKRAKTLEKATSTTRSSYDSVFASRYSFKVSFFYEFLGQKAQALKYYGQCFRSLVDASSVVEEDLIDQV